MTETAVNLDSTMRDSYAALDRQVRVTAPKWLRRRGLVFGAEDLEELQAITDWDSWRKTWLRLEAICTCLPDVTLTDRESIEPIKAEACSDGWQADNDLGKWAAQESHYWDLGHTTQSWYSSSDYGPMIIQSSWEARYAAYQIIRHCVYTEAV